MFAEYDVTNFPKVQVKFGKTVKNDEDFRNFIKEWLALYKKKEAFYFLMDTSDTGLVPIKYCFKMSKFISHLKKNNKTSLKYSIILVYNQFVSILLKFIFVLSKPVAPVYLVKTKEDYLKLDEALKNGKMNKDIKYSYVKSYKEK